jgi:hypothetical protein
MPAISENSERRRALQLLARSPSGCTESLLLAHGFSPEMVGRLVLDGLVTTQVGVVQAGWRALTVTWIEITESGLYLDHDRGARGIAAP